jgi:hypothetical protein
MIVRMSPQEVDMKILNVLLLLAMAALLGACAVSNQPKNRPAEQWDSAYIQAVEDAAENQPSGLDVIWINPPAAKKDVEDSGSR